MKYTDSTNILYIINIYEVREVNHEICHDIFTNASTYAFYMVPMGLQRYA